jgi:hypothetical protein
MIIRTNRRTAIVSSLALVAGGSALGIAGVAVSAPSAAAASCAAAGTTGLTAAVIAQTGQTITSNVDATGCGIGIYVGPSVTGVTIDGATVSGANDHGIMAEGTSSLLIENSTIKGNGVSPTANIDTNKAVLLVGVTNSTVTGNTVTGNVADGGISVTDEGGGVDPGTPGVGPQQPAASSHDTISDNTISDNYGGCGIIVESWVPGAGVSDITVTGNQIVGAPGQFGPHGPVIGQIVVATDAPGASVAGPS